MHGLSCAHQVCSGTYCFNFTYNYIGANMPLVQLVNPSEGSSMAATPTTITVQNFPAVFTASQIEVQLATIGSASVQSFSTTASGLLLVSATIPLSKREGTFAGSVYRGDLPDASASLSWRYVQPAPLFAPIDGTLAGGTSVRITAYWGVAQTGPGDMEVTFGGRAGVVSSMLASSDTATVINALTPPGTTDGLVDVVLTGKGGMRTTFKFEYYNPPTIVDVQPRTATVDGRVQDCPSCILDNDGNTISIWIQNFPALTSVADVSVLINNVECNGQTCRVKNFVNLATSVGFCAVCDVHAPKHWKNLHVVLCTRLTCRHVEFFDVRSNLRMFSPY
jgi:hypothetical protein